MNPRPPHREGRSLTSPTPTLGEQPNRINIHDAIQALCDTLQLNIEDVVRLDIRPATVEATLLERNDQGAAYFIYETLDKRRAATRTQTFQVTT